MLDLAGLFGAIIGVFLINALALFLTKRWSDTPEKILAIGAALFFVLSIADNAVRTEPFTATAIRIGAAQVIVSALLLARHWFSRRR